jgi:hypothetical protein
MRQPDNEHSKMFGNDGELGNDAEIIVYYEYLGEPEPVLHIPFWFNKEGLDMGRPFSDMVDNVAKALEEAYSFWPEGYIHIQTRINREFINMI